MSSLACKWNWHNTGHQVWYDKSTFETIRATYPLYFYEDFTGAAGGSVFDGTSIWNVVQVGDGTSAIVADSSNGEWLLHCHATHAANDAVLYQYNTALGANNKTFDIGNGLIFETRINMSTIPMTGVTAVAGMVGDHHVDKDTVAYQSWFRWQASAATLCESDDGVLQDNNDISTGLTAVAGTYNIYRIDFTDLTDIKYFVDGARVCASTTFDLSALSAANQQMQPYFSLDKTDGLDQLGDMTIDYVKIWSNRS